MVNKLNILIFITFFFHLSLASYNYETRDFQILETEANTKEKIIIKEKGLYVVTKAKKNLILSHSLIVPRNRKSLENCIFYATCKSFYDIRYLDYKKIEDLDIEMAENNTIKYTGAINVEEGEYGITLFKELVEGESVIIETFQMTNTLAVFIIMYIIVGILILIVLTIVFIKKYCCRPG